MFARINIIGSQRGAPATPKSSAWHIQATSVDNRFPAAGALLRRRRAAELDSHFGPQAIGREAKCRFFSSPFAGLIVGFIAMVLAGPLATDAR